MNLFLSSYIVCTMLFVYIALKINKTYTTSLILFGYTYMSLSFFVGVLNYFLFRWFFSLDLITNDFLYAYTHWMLGFVVISFSMLIYNKKFEKKINENENRYYATADNASIISITILTVIIIIGSIGAFYKAGVIPMLADNVEVARGNMATAGILNQFIFLNTFSIPLCYIIAKYRISTAQKFFIYCLIAISFIILIFHGMRNYLLVSILIMVFATEYKSGKTISKKMLSMLALLSIVILLTIGQYRSGYDSPEGLTQAALRLFSGVFSEFREWPEIFIHKEVDFISPLRYVLVFIPSIVFDVFGFEKTDWLFSSGSYYRELLGREFEGVELGLRTSIYGDFYVISGSFAFLIVPVIYVLVINYFSKTPKTLESLCLNYAVIMAMIIGFSSELSTLILKITSLYAAYLFYKCVRIIFKNALL